MRKPPQNSVNSTDSAAVAVKPKPLPPAVIAKINLSTQRLEVIVGGSSKHSWAISSGREGFELPRGTFRAQWTAKMWFSRKYDMAPMPHAVFFKDGVAIHATSSTGMLGQPASHGCIRLAPANAALFYSLVQKHGVQNVQVQVFGTPPAPRIARRDIGPRDGLRGGQANGQRLTYLPPGSPYAGRHSFVHNGIVYVRVR